MTIPGRDELLERLESRDLFVSPRPPGSAVSDGTIDLSIGNLILYSTRSSVPSIDIARPHEGGRLFSELYIRDSAPFVLQPNQFALASTLEYIALPADYAGLIQSRSTFGRMGLVSVAAAWVSPGYRGSPTLELFNAGDVALALTPGVRVCQLVLQRAEGSSGSRSRYRFHTRPYFAQAEVDDWLTSIDEACAPWSHQQRASPADP